MPTVSCSTCNLIITRSDKDQTQCTFCKKIYHLGCCNSDWFINTSTVNCCNPNNSPRTPRHSTFSTSNTSSTTTITSGKRCASQLSPGTVQTEKQQKVDSTKTLPINTSKMGDEDMPAYFKRFMVPFDQLCSDVKDTKALVDNQVKTQEVMRHDLSHLVRQQALSDTNEILINGVPNNDTLTELQVVRAVLKALDLSHLTTHILDTRPWTFRPTPAATISTTDNNSQDISPDLSENNSQGNQKNDQRPSNQMPKDYHSIVFKLSSPSVRDFIISKSSKLAKFDAKSIFGVGGKYKVFLRALWPKPVHDLLRQTAAITQERNCNRPYVKNLNVYVKPTRDSDPIHIRSQSDLDLIPMLDKA